MSKSIVVFFLCLYAMSATVIRPKTNSVNEGNKAEKELKAVNSIDEGQLKELRLVSQKANSSQVDFFGGKSSNGDQLAGFSSNVCDNGGWYTPCNGGCYIFSYINSLKMLGTFSHTFVLFEGAGCTGVQHVYNLAGSNQCYNQIPYAVSAICYQ